VSTTRFVLNSLKEYLLLTDAAVDAYRDFCKGFRGGYFKAVTFCRLPLFEKRGRRQKGNALVMHPFYTIRIFAFAAKILSCTNRGLFFVV
jgi:hypothetical protein